MINLVKNALKFTKNGTILIRVCYLESPDNLLVVEVIDTGTGITAKEFPLLFTRFGKMARTAQINSEGLGLGLTIVDQIVESSHGCINVLSNGQDQGSIFRFSMEMLEADNDNQLIE